MEKPIKSMEKPTKSKEKPLKSMEKTHKCFAYGTPPTCDGGCVVGPRSAVVGVNGRDAEVVTHVVFPYFFRFFHTFYRFLYKF